MPGEQAKTKVYKIKRKPPMCRKCLEYGHSVKYCRGNLSCARCGRADHEADDCQESQKSCFHCDEDHYAGSKVCKERKKRKNSLHSKNVTGIPWPGDSYI